MVDDVRVAPRLRAAAGVSLAKLGDPRPEVMTVEGTQFCYVPAGPFWMGSGDDDGMAYDDEKPQHELSLDDYWIGHYPVTNAQFLEFVRDAEGYRGDRWWTRDGLAWRGTRTGPHDPGEPYNLPNHPLVNVTWYEALAFTRWLTARLGEANRLPRDWAVTLPSEAEWEKAARGGQYIPLAPVIHTIVQPGVALGTAQNDNPRRRFPWGRDPDPNRANYGDTGIGATSAVGCFPGGESVYGCADMAGNVWEWTRSLSGEYPYQPGDDRENLEAGEDVTRVLRGGSFDYEARRVRCSARLSNHPGDFLWYFGLRLSVSPIDSDL